MKKDRITDKRFKDINNPFSVDRRDFLKYLGGGIVIAVSAGSLQTLFGKEMPLLQRESDFNAYLRVGEDGRVTLLTGKICMGQGPITSLPMELADELDVALDKVDIIMGDTDLCPWDMGTFGSLSTRMFGQAMRPAAAEARAVLMELASEKLSVPVSKLVAMDGIISDIDDEKIKVSYTELAKGQKIYKTLDRKPPMKDHTQFKVMGKPRLRVDSVDKVTGKAKYAGDIRLPGMLYARIVRPPALHARLKSVDTSGAEKISGIKIFREDDLVAVLHEHPDTADVAVSKVKAEYEVPEPTVNHNTIYEHLLKSASESDEVGKAGDLATGQSLSAVTFDHEYHDRYVAHAPVENHTATAMMEGERMIIWASTQTPYPAKEEVAEALGMPQENIHVRQVFVGGGFGGKSAIQQVIEAARMAKATGKPVQVAWTRREEFLYDHLRPAAVVKIKSGITGGGNVTLWDYNVYFAGSRGSTNFYDLPHHRILSWDTGGDEPSAHPFFTGAWRAPANNTNTFARESQLDIMAAKAGIDPVEFRLKNLKDEKMIRVLKTAADKFGWTPAAGPSGRGFGVACGIDAGTYVTLMAEVAVDRATGYVQVKRVVVVQDMGMVVNPQGAVEQAEGCVTMGLGYALTEDIQFEGSNMLTRNFDTYEFTRFSWVPEIDVVLIDAQDKPPQGGGEPVIICVGGVVANGIFDACGVRLFSMPMNKGKVLEALKEV